MAANFLADETMIKLASEVLPGSKINIGYPAICESEYEMCSRILKHASSDITELCVVGHAREDHLEKMAEVIKEGHNVTANSWIPISNYFLNETVKVSPKNTFNGLKTIIQKWKQKSENPFDIAFADCTSCEENLPQRIYEWTDYCLNNGVRNVIICDTRGIGIPEQMEDLFSKLKVFGNQIEFHPHNDNGYALENIALALAQGIETIGTSFYGAGERQSMIDPRGLVRFGLSFDECKFNEFEKKYSETIGDPVEIIRAVYGLNVIVTGSQYRLRRRSQNLKMKFGVTSDIYILSKILGRKIDSGELSEMKDLFLYTQKNIVLSPEQLIKEYYKMVQITCQISQ
ncbi:MAG: hypothetical protein KKF46_00945 [Nanoarchaeota archaeon]|nr:hypothetical protein [Nanoarchaeota archaeon]MBU1320901.1 hypothetical protein [Nanoarchaeota archaeon]MBU1597574.1 hypothetical protein [Nanoarchaeota archaeon]MBU2441511.1 hypothetical protein [Nanoarchaeota archaeon]